MRHPHLVELQSIRGLAAVCVLLHHCLFLFATSDSFHYWAEVIFNAHAAVMIFFVLSGYVLGMSLSDNKLTIENSLRFYCSRLFRIYPALWAASTMAVVYVFALHFNVPTENASDWYMGFYKERPTSTQILENFVADRFDLIWPTWSVRVELLASLLLPLIVLFVNRGQGLVMLAATIALAVCALHFGHGGRGVMFWPTFVIGVLAFKYQRQVGACIANRTCLWAALLVLLTFRRLSSDWRFDVGYEAFTPTIVESVAAAVVIVGIVEMRLAVLRRDALVWLGNISYSLYLIHFVVMSALAKVIGQIAMTGEAQAVSLALITLALSWGLSHFLYDYIEKPGIKLGRALLKRWRSSAADRVSNIPIAE